MIVGGTRGSGAIGRGLEDLDGLEIGARVSIHKWNIGIFETYNFGPSGRCLMRTKSASWRLTIKNT